jgi:hypothetical protein
MSRRQIIATLNPSQRPSQTLSEYLSQNCATGCEEDIISRHVWLFNLKLNDTVYVGGCYWVNTGIFLVKALSDLYIQLNDGRIFNRTGIDAGKRMERGLEGWIDNPKAHSAEVDALLLRLGLAKAIQPKL